MLLFSQSKFFDEGIVKFNKKAKKEWVQMLYRGWMLSEEQYIRLYDALNIYFDGYSLQVNNPQDYKKMHFFPNVYEEIKKHTPKMLVYKKDKQIDIDYVNCIFDRYMVKDYVKSVKETEFPKYFTKKTTQKEFDESMNIFYKYRGPLFTGGICIKEFVDLEEIELRVFYFGNTLIYEISEEDKIKYEFPGEEFLNNF
ncbi:hypothetical protein [Streptobacillus canis]|uniref:hypothetical protein n=1 Tax=Streptobacillus canis TaxID=2678686 RepID=UPI0018CC455C|nr:hypothetical protein [Streptobacillus canis]